MDGTFAAGIRPISKLLIYTPSAQAGRGDYSSDRIEVTKVETSGIKSEIGKNEKSAKINSIWTACTLFRLGGRMGQGICHNTCMSVAKLTVNPTPNTGRGYYST